MKGKSLNKGYIIVLSLGEQGTAVLHKDLTSFGFLPLLSKIKIYKNLKCARKMACKSVKQLVERFPDCKVSITEYNMFLNWWEQKDNVVEVISSENVKILERY